MLVICKILKPSFRYNEEDVIIEIDKYQCYSEKDLKVTLPLAVNSLCFTAEGKPKINLFFDDEKMMEKLYLYIIKKQGYL